MLRQNRKLRQPPYQNGTGQAVSEYMVFIVLIIGAFILMQNYILRGFSGRWKSVGDSLGFGRLYDPHKTIECLYDYEFLNIWYSAEAFAHNGCHQPCHSTLLNEEERGKKCRDCICQSQDDYCDEPLICD